MGKDMAEDKLLEVKVLEYWFALEFLAQDKYPQKELTDASYAIKDLKYKLSKGEQSRIKAPFHFFEIDITDNLYEKLRKEAELCRMKKWGNITVYIGKVKREACIRSIAQMLSFDGEKDSRPERNHDDITCVSLQLSPEGKYIENSLSLSTILWAAKQVNDCRGEIAGCLDEAEYSAVVDAMEMQFFPEENTQRIQADNLEKEEPTGAVKEKQGSVKEVQASAKNRDAAIQKFDVNAVKMTVFKEIYKYIEKTYLSGKIPKVDDLSPYELTVGISYQMFVDEETRSSEEDDNYLGLSHDFFSSDLKMVLDKAKRGDRCMPQHVSDYIVSTYKAVTDNDSGKRIDLVHRSGDEDTYECQVQEILNVANAPLGKWPSRYMPAFMQQIAINLAINKGRTKLFETNGKIFSVNGPPGTGKTTLLKEIVVSNIIEKALLLAEYNDPDDAFEEHSFEHGPKPNQSYSTYVPHWYSIRNDAINDYSVLVTSCNNAAVENISKELPKGSGLLKGLLPAEDDAEKMKEALKEVSNLFDAAQSGEFEVYNDYGNRVECQDVYFTFYARRLLEDESAWGLVAAALGKRKNLKGFYEKVLKSMSIDFYSKCIKRVNNSNPPKYDKSRLSKYHEAKSKFLSQVKLVRKMQGQIANLCEVSSELCMLKGEIEKAAQEYEIFSAEGKSRKAKIQAEESEIEKQISLRMAEREDILKQKEELEKKKNNLGIKRRETESDVSILRQKAAGVMAAIGKEPLFFGKKVYREKAKYAEKAASDFDMQADRAAEAIPEIDAQLSFIEKAYDNMIETLAKTEAAADRAGNEIQRLRNEKSDIDRVLSYKLEIFHDKKERKENLNAKYQLLCTELGEGRVMDEEFIKDILSGDTQESTSAQVSNPWFTQTYNREREKLFYDAMQLNKEFVLSSKSCKDNFRTLASYWGFEKDENGERIVFHKEDREAFASSLYQTLFLFVPVISTTFASVGSFMRDLKDIGAIGTLIVDEAGQAQPQMAVGALYRSRKAVIVGDPKQVEPVVTDDLKLLKKAFDDRELNPYITDKHISVQSCADEMNIFGTYLEDPDHGDNPDWVGCPLLVHRRCISPMYEISNAISYNGLMKQKTGQPSKETEKTFIYDKSQWIQAEGREEGKGKHFVAEQGQKVCEMLEAAFERKAFPSVYVISPFTTVVSGMRNYLWSYVKSHPASAISRSKELRSWITKNMGTVHTFQGKEANEVIFLLGCDGSKDAEGAVDWVNSNIVNVAATRAKYRLYIIGDGKVWMRNENLCKAKNIIDTFAIKEIHSIISDETLSEEEKKRGIREAARNLPSVTSFPTEKTVSEDGEVDYSVDTEGLAMGLDTYSFMKVPFTQEQLQKFGFSSQKELNQLRSDIKINLEFGMRLFFFFQPIYKINKEFDASCCGIMFCKTMELQMRECFSEKFRQIIPDFKIKGGIKIKDARPHHLTLGAYQDIIKKNSLLLGQRMVKASYPTYNEEWWRSFAEKLSACAVKRNRCCHAGIFQWRQVSQLLADMFRESGESPKLAGLLFESEVGKLL